MGVSRGKRAGDGRKINGAKRSFGKRTIPSCAGKAIPRCRPTTAKVVGAQAVQKPCGTGSEGVEKGTKNKKN